MANNEQMDTSSFVKKVHETQEKQAKNRRTHGQDHPESKLPNHQH